MSSKSSREGKLYSELGASSSKQGIYSAIGKGVTDSTFVDMHEDPCGDHNYRATLHSDGAGTKCIAAYLAFRESGEINWFRNLAWDSLVMNLDDVACVNAFDSLTLTNTIGRNRRLIPDEAVGEIVKGYTECIECLEEYGISIRLSGGETADVGDSVRTLVVDSSLFARGKSDGLITTDRIVAGDIIVGLSSTGKAKFEALSNSGIGSNGITLARHALIAEHYVEKYPEIGDPMLNQEPSYFGKGYLFDTPGPLTENIATSLLSPTRPYAPIIRQLASELGDGLHAVIHCTGGGQSKIVRFGKNKRFVKDALFPCPPIFALIQRQGGVAWEEMYTVFNMGHRMEVILPEEHAGAVIDTAAKLEIEAKIIGRVEEGDGQSSVVIKGPHGTFEYR